MGEWLKKVIVACLSCTFTVALLEGGLRLFQSVELEKAAEEEQEEEKGFMRKDGVLEWFPEEGTRQEYQDPYGQPYVLRINSTGQRGGEVGQRQPGERRLLFLGDSFTMASGLKEEDIFATRVGDLLPRPVSGAVRIINGGVDAYNTLQEMSYYHYYGKELEADIAVLFFYAGNDYRDNAVRTGRGRSLNPVLIRPEILEKYRDVPDPFLRDERRHPLLDPLSGTVVPRPNSPLLETLAHNSLLARLAGARYARLKGRWTGDLWAIDLESRFYFYEIGLYQQRRDVEFEIAVNLTLEFIGQLQRLVAEEGAEFMVVLIPSQNQVDPKRWQRTLDLLDVEESALGPLDMVYPHRLVEEFCIRQGIACLDLLDVFAAADRPEDLYLTHIDNLHFSPAGHQLAAREIADFIAAKSAFLRHPAVDSYRRGLDYDGRSETRMAEESLKQAIAQKSDWDRPYIALADLYRAAKRWTEAGQLYRRALDCNAQSLAAQEGLGEVATTLGDAAGAIAAYRRALELRPSWWPYYQKLQDLYTRAKRMGGAQEAKQRQEAFFAAPTKEKRFWWIEHLARGDAYVAKEQWPEAALEYTRALKFTDDERESPETFYNLGLTLKYQGKKEEALPSFDRAFELAPELVQAGMEAALLHGEVGDVEKAVRLLEMVVERAPQWPDAWINLGAFRARNGQFKKARQAFEKGLELAPGNPQARANLESLDKLNK